jgi:hypothetical protein
VGTVSKGLICTALVGSLLINQLLPVLARIFQQTVLKLTTIRWHRYPSQRNLSHHGEAKICPEREPSEESQGVRVKHDGYIML